MRSKKISGSSLQENSFYFRLFEYIHKNNTLPKNNNSTFSKLPELKGTKNLKQRINYHIGKLKTLGLIKKISYNVWKTDMDRFNQLKFQKEVKKSLQTGKRSKKRPFKNDIRGHGFIITFKLPKINKWTKERRIKYLNKKDMDFKPVGAKECGQRIMVRGHKIHLYDKAIVIYSPPGSSYFSDNAKTSDDYAIHDLKQILHSVENILNIKASFRDGYKFRVSRRHHAHVNNKLAEQYTRQGKKISCRKDGKEWLIIDSSYTPELETTDNETSVEDQDDIIQPFFNSLKRHYEQTGESITIDNLIKLFGSMAKSQQETNRATENIMEKMKEIEKYINNQNQ